MVKALKIFLLPILIFALFGCNSSEVEKEAITEITFSFWEPGMAHELEDALQKIAEEYEELHPDIRIRLISEPVETYQDMIKSGIISDSLPDIQSNHSAKLLSQYNAGLIVNISDKLNSKSAYGSEAIWKDSFKQQHIEEEYGDKFIPFFGAELGIYYNKDMYNQLGLKVPTTWSEFINNCEVIEKTGKLPVAFMAQKMDACAWIKWDIAGGLFAKKHIGDKNININGDTAVSTYEVYRAILTGKLNFADSTEYQQEYREYIKRISEFLKYCGGYPGFEETVAKAMFLSGEAAHIQTGSWDAYGMMKNDSIDFEVGIFNFPMFTEKETPYAGKRMKHLSTQTIAVTKSVYKEEGKLEKVIDFLQYFTSKEVHQEFINSTAQIPVVKGVEYVEGTEIFDFDGYAHDMLLLKDENNDIIYSILSGNTPALDREFFESMQEKIMLDAKKYAEVNSLSPENNYYKEEVSEGVAEDEE